MSATTAAAVASSAPSKPSGYRPVVPGRLDFDMVRARDFVLMDGHGHVRGGLGFNDQGNATIMLCDAHPDRLVPRLELVLDDTRGPFIILTDAQGKHRLTLSWNGAAGTVGCLMQDARGNRRLAFGLRDAGPEDPATVPWGMRPSSDEFVRYATHLADAGRLKDLYWTARCVGWSPTKARSIVQLARESKKGGRGTRARQGLKRNIVKTGPHGGRR